jgi:hypothetical protein
MGVDLTFVSGGPGENCDAAPALAALVSDPAPTRLYSMEIVLETL